MKSRFLRQQTFLDKSEPSKVETLSLKARELGPPFIHHIPYISQHTQTLLPRNQGDNF